MVSLIVIAAAAVVAGLCNGPANRMLAQAGLSLPLLTGATDTASAQVPQEQGGGAQPAGALGTVEGGAQQGGRTGTGRR